MWQTLLQSASGTTKFDSYYKVRRNKGESNLSELTEAINLISDKFDDYERERREKDKIIKELKSEVPVLHTTVENLENQLDFQEQYSCRNCILIHGITETHRENTDDISLRTINEHLEEELMENDLDRTHRIDNPKSDYKRPRPIIVKFVRCSTRRKVFVNKKRSKKYRNFNYRRLDQTQDGILKSETTSLTLIMFGRLMDEFVIMMR